MADRRLCEQCGTPFVPRREHARFCCVPCRVAWNRGHVGDSVAGASALQWSITAMSETARRLPRAGAWDRSQAFGVIGEAVWWVTIVDATLVRHHPAEYDRVLGLRNSGYASVVCCAVGYRAAGDKYAGLPKVRFEIKDLVRYV